MLPITRSVDLAQKCLAEMPTGGKTPLADGLSTALVTLGMLNKKDSELEPILILVTDGRANAIEENSGDPVESALKMAEKFGRLKLPPLLSILKQILLNWVWPKLLPKQWEQLIIAFAVYLRNRF